MKTDTQQHASVDEAKGQGTLAPATGSRTREVANKAEDCILFLRMNRLIRESEVIMIRQKIQKRIALCAQKPSPPNESSSPTAGGGSGGAQPKGTNEK